MIKDQEHSRRSQDTPSCIAHGHGQKSGIHCSLINPAQDQHDHQRQKKMQKPVYIPAPEYDRPAHRKAVVQILLLLLKQIEKLKKRQK